MGKFDGPPDGVDENREKELRRLARMLATQRMNKQTSLRYAQFALRDIPEVFDWLVKLYEHLTKDQNLTLRWFSPHRVRGRLNRWTVAFAIGPADGSPEDNTALFRLDDGTLDVAELITNEDELFPRLAIMLAWDAENKLAAAQRDWHNAILTRLRNDLLNRALKFHPEVRTHYIRNMVEGIANDEAATMEKIILGYLALGFKPGAAMAQALRKLDLPVPSLEETPQE